MIGGPEIHSEGFGESLQQKFWEFNVGQRTKWGWTKDSGEVLEIRIC